MNTFFLSILAVGIGVCCSAAQAQQSSIPVDSLVTPSGHLRPGLNINGSVDLHGWELTVDGDGTPRFVESGRSKNSELAAAPVSGDECWEQGFGPGGIHGKVYVMSARGSDLFIGGLFRLAGSVLANNLVRYSMAERQWHLVGDESGEGTGGAVYALTWAGDDLFVGGRFNRAGSVDANGVARFNRTTNRWFALGSGVRNDVDQWPFLTPYGGAVYALAATPQGLFVGGDFDEAGGKRIHNMARWNYDASEWTYACRVEEEEPNGNVYALLHHDSTVYAGGAFTRVGLIDASHIASIPVYGGHFQALGAGIDGDVRALGWHAGELYVGGGFANAGGASARNIARWNGGAWLPVGPGVDGRVLSLSTAAGQLVAGGEFRRAGNLSVNGIVSWRNGEWRALAEGMSGGTPTSVWALAESQGDIVAGGMFTTAGTAPVGAVARWDTLRSAWSGLGDTAFTGQNGVNGNVFALAVRNNELFIAGDFDRVGSVRAPRIARYDRSSQTWSAVGGGITSPASFVRSMSVAANGDLYVSGIFTEAGGVSAVGIARWDGTTWSSVGGGVAGPTPYVFATSVSGDTLLAGGAFESAGGVTSPRVARFDITRGTWHSVGGGITGDTTYSFVSSVVSSGASVYVGGIFHRAGGQEVNFVAQYDGTTWKEMAGGVNGPVSVMIADGAGILVGGEFTRAGGNDLRYLARWDGAGWTSIGAAPDGPVRSIQHVGAQLAIGGEFETVGGASTPYLVIGSGGTWRSPGAPPNGPVRAIVVDRGDVVTGGDFVQIGEVRANHVARFEQTGWTALGSDPRIGLSSQVLAVALIGSDLYVGGGFRTSGGVAVNGIARWNGQRWLSVGGGVRGGDQPKIRTMAVASNGDLYVGGEFDTAGTAVARSVARWDGIRWTGLGEGIALDNQQGIVRTLFLDDSLLYIGGRFTLAGSTAATSLAQWNPTTGLWSATPDGDVTYANNTPGDVSAIAAFDGGLYVGGRFDKVGDRGIVNIGAFDPGTASWSSPITSMRPVTAMASDGSQLIVASGYVDTVRDVIGNIVALVPIRILQRYQGGTWSTLDSSYGRINALSFAANGDLYVGGRFSTTQGVISAGVVRFDGTRWLGLGSGVKDVVIDTSTFGQSVGDSLYTLGDPDVFSLAPLASGTGVWAGGQFKIAGLYPSLYIAKWTDCTVAGTHDRDPQTRSTDTPMNLYPNPARDALTLRLPWDTEGTVTVAIISTRGDVQLPPRTVVPSVEGHELLINLSGLSVGSYFCKVTTATSSYIAPFVVVR